MSSQIEKHLAIYGGGQTMVEKIVDWKTHVHLWIHSNARVGPQRITYLILDLRLLRILKLLHTYISLFI